MNYNNGSLTVEWENFGLAFSHDMWQFYMSKQFSDVTICTEDGFEIQSHRIILAMCSVYFRELFKKNDATNQIVCLSNISFDTVKKIFALIYGGAVEVPASDVRSFFRAAKFLKLQGFENVPSINAIISDADIQQTKTRKNYSIILKRIDEHELTMGTSNGANDEVFDFKLSQPMTSSQNTGGNNDGGGGGGGSGSSDGNGNGSGGDAGSDTNIECEAEHFPMLSSSSSESEGDNFGSADENSDIVVDSV